MKLFTVLSCLSLAVLSCYGLVCDQKSVNSRSYRYAQATVPNPIQQVYIVSRRSRTTCDLQATYGFHDNIIWTNRGCRATFNVCYQPSTDLPTRTTEVDCDSTGFAKRSCAVSAGAVLAVSVKIQKSSSPCLPGASFYGHVDSIVVDHGCRARFFVTTRA